MRIACCSSVAVCEGMSSCSVNQYSADGTSALASRASCTPFLVSTAVKRRRPRLPSPPGDRCSQERQVRVGSKRGAEHVLEPPGQLARVDRGVLLGAKLLLPECLRIFLGPLRQRDQRRVTLGDQDWLTGTEAGAVPGEQQPANLIRLHVDPRLRCGEHGAGREPHEIAREGQFARFVEVVDPPDLPLSRISPDAEVRHVQIAHRQQHVLAALCELRDIPSATARPTGRTLRAETGTAHRASSWCFFLSSRLETSVRFRIHASNASVDSKMLRIGSLLARWRAQTLARLSNPSVLAAWFVV